MQGNAPIVELLSTQGFQVPLERRSWLEGGCVLSPVKAGTLPDSEIKSMCVNGQLIVENYEAGCVQQACYELRAGTVYYDLGSSPPTRHSLDGGGHILLKPKQLLVSITMETLRLPLDILGRILTKGKLFSIGVLPVNTYADPGFVGNLGLVLYNLSNRYLRIAVGTPIAKIEFSRLEEPVQDGYHGQHGYRTQIWPVPSDMVVSSEDLQADPRIGTDLEETAEAYGDRIGDALWTVFSFHRKLGLFTVSFVALSLVVIVAVSHTNWVSQAAGFSIGVLSSIVAGVILFLATKPGRRRRGPRRTGKDTKGI